MVWSYMTLNFFLSPGVIEQPRLKLRLDVCTFTRFVSGQITACQCEVKTRKTGRSRKWLSLYCKYTQGNCFVQLIIYEMNAMSGLVIKVLRHLKELFQSYYKPDYEITRLTAHFMCGLMSVQVICKLRKSMVIHDTKCPFWNQVSLKTLTNQPTLQSDSVEFN